MNSSSMICVNNQGIEHNNRKPVFHYIMRNHTVIRVINKHSLSTYNAPHNTSEATVGKVKDSLMEETDKSI